MAQSRLWQTKMQQVGTMNTPYPKTNPNWIASAIGNPGSLHKQLGIKQGKKIPIKILNAAAKKGGLLGKRARLAKTLRGFKK